jgi:hypothetical protein
MRLFLDIGLSREQFPRHYTRAKWINIIMRTQTRDGNEDYDQ